MPENLIGLLVIGAIALGNWLLERYRNQQQSGDSSPDPLRKEKRWESPPSGSGKGNPEEEKIKRFFEALGLPPDGESPVPPSSGNGPAKRAPVKQRVPTPTPAQPAPMAKRETALPQPPRRTVVQTRPVIPAAPAIPAAPLRPQPVSQPEPRPSSFPIQPDEEPVAAFSGGAAQQRDAMATGRVSAASLEGQVAALRRTAAQGASPVTKGAYALRENEVWLDRDALRRRLSDVKAVREAYVLREILGPPKALQE